LVIFLVPACPPSRRLSRPPSAIRDLF